MTLILFRGVQPMPQLYIHHLKKRNLKKFLSCHPMKKDTTANGHLLSPENKQPETYTSGIKDGFPCLLCVHVCVHVCFHVGKRYGGRVEGLKRPQDNESDSLLTALR